MFNFFGMMRHNYGYSSRAIEDKLDQSNCPLDSLLEEEEIISEMKNQNQKLIN